jgi:hypothetical protein
VIASVYPCGVLPEEPEHHHHAGHTGQRWLDITLALSAMFVSLISLVLAIVHGRTMERMADANTRMVEASSWPFIQFDTHNIDEHGAADVRLVLTNKGIGPARVQTFELWWNGHAMASPLALIKACCSGTPAELAQTNTTAFGIGSTAPSILRAGDHSDFFSVPSTPKNVDLWNRFNVERDKITVRVCYCSVFNECWVGSGTTTQATPVAACTKPEVPYDVPGR